mmetsp:Transcript_60483/g.148397  ORF Transcript_60483/g.148397 Transcript_60483/m.148397 type:complete len:376 (+) Transcript_60483:118-1245(+)
MTSSSSSSSTERQRIEDRLRPDSTFRVAFWDPRENDDDYDDDGDANATITLKMKKLDRPQYVLGYWSIRGLASALKVMLCAAGADHWVVMYDVSEKNDADGGDIGWDKSSYLSDKAWMKEEYNPLMNLPFLVDCANQRIIVQTDAIFLFLGRKLGMLGSNEVEQSICEQLICETMDLRNNMVRFAYAGTDSDGNMTSYEHDKSDAEKLCNGPAKRILDKLELYMEQKRRKDSSNASPPSRCHLVGDTFSAPDFHLWEMLDQFEGLCRYYKLESLLATRSHLKTFKIMFEDLPRIRGIVGDPQYQKSLPYNNPYARFGSNPETLGRYVRGMDAPWRSNGTVDFVKTITQVDPFIGSDIFDRRIAGHKRTIDDAETK